MRLGSRNRQGDRQNRQMFLKRPGVEPVFPEKAASCERLRNFAMSLRWVAKKTAGQQRDNPELRLRSLCCRAYQGKIRGTS